MDNEHKLYLLNMTTMFVKMGPDSYRPVGSKTDHDRRTWADLLATAGRDGTIHELHIGRQIV